MPSVLKKIKKAADETGQAIILFAFLFMAICGASAIVVDYGGISVTRSQLQTAVDAASLAAARELPDTAKAANVANTYVQYNADGLSGISVSFSDANNTVHVTAQKTVPYTFARIFGQNSKTVSASAAASRGGVSAAFDYALFSGDTNSQLELSITGSGQYVYGSAHSNHQFSISGSGHYITGSAEAASSFSIQGSSITIGGTCQGSSVSAKGSNINVGKTVAQAAPIIDMPDFSETIRQQAQAAGQTYVGNVSFVGGSITLNSSIFVDGDVTISGNRFTGNGCIMATGNIRFNGSSLTNGAGNSICFYSQNGNIDVIGSGAVVNGILYAPNGTVSITGSGAVVNGRVIGHRLSLTGSGFRIVSSPNDLNSLNSISKTRLVA